MRRGNVVAVASVSEKDGRYQGNAVLTVPLAHSFCEHYRTVDTVSDTELDAMERAKALAQLILKGLYFAIRALRCGLNCQGGISVGVVVLEPCGRYPFLNLAVIDWPWLPAMTVEAAIVL